MLNFENSPPIRLILRLLVSACVIFVGGATAKEEVDTGALRLMSFNIKQHNPDNRKLADSPNRWELRKELVFDLVRDKDLDIVAVQEAYRHQLDDLLEALPAFHAVGEGRDGGTKGEYCPILFRTDRFRVEEFGTFWLSDSPEKPSISWGHFYRRICTWVRLSDLRGGRPIHVFNTHLDHQSQPARERSVRLIVQRMHEALPDGNVLLAGDLNADEDNPVIRYLKGSGEMSNPMPMIDTFRAVNPDAKQSGTGSRFSGATDGPKVDYLFVPPDAKVLAAQIVRTHKDGRYPSDHYPVTAVVRFRKTQ